MTAQSRVRNGGRSPIDRRQLIRRAAAIGVVAWAAPQVESLGSAAFAASPSVPAGGGSTTSLISYVAVIYSRSVTTSTTTTGKNGKTTTTSSTSTSYYTIKYDGSGSVYTQSTGIGSGNLSSDDDGLAQRLFAAQLADSVPRQPSSDTDYSRYVSATNPDGSLTLRFPATDNLVGWVVHDGAGGCQVGGVQRKSFAPITYQGSSYNYQGHTSVSTVGSGATAYKTIRFYKPTPTTCQP